MVYCLGFCIVVDIMVQLMFCFSGPYISREYKETLNTNTKPPEKSES